MEDISRTNLEIKAKTCIDQCEKMIQKFAETLGKMSDTWYKELSEMSKTLTDCVAEHQQVLLYLEKNIAFGQLKRDKLSSVGAFAKFEELHKKYKIKVEETIPGFIVTYPC